MKKILIVFGTRPEAIKMAPLIKKLQLQPEVFETIVCVTGQHREMLDQVLRIFDIIPDYDLNIMKHDQDLYDITSGILLGMRDVIKKVQPDLVLVHGDTTTSTTTALAAFYQHIPVSHIEAGLRTQNIYSPWPEELNRQITSRIACFHFAPTKMSMSNLIAEGVDANKIEVTGNTVIDALQMVLKKIKNDQSIERQIKVTLAQEGIDELLIRSWSETRHLVLITGHRRENFGEGFLNICKAIKELAIKYPNVDYVYPVHLNPHVKKPVYDILGKDLLHPLNNIYLISPLDYLPFVYLMDRSHIVLTDSGGIQEEAPSLGKPVIVMRDTTERPEAIYAGTVKLAGTNRKNIINEVSRLLSDRDYYQSIAQAVNPYGDGYASERIAEVLKHMENEKNVMIVDKSSQQIRPIHSLVV